MSPRLSHSARFALPTVVAVLLAGLAYELVAAFVRRAVPEGTSAGAAILANMGTWALIALVMSVVTFLLHLSDAVTRPPGRRFAWLAATWSALGALAAVFLLEVGQPGAAVGTALVLALLWQGSHRFIPGWPGRPPEGEPAVPPAPTGGPDLR